MRQYVGAFLNKPGHRMKSYCEITRVIRIKGLNVEADLAHLLPRVNLSQGILRKVSTVQQLKFALKYHATPIMPHGWSLDAITAGIMKTLGLNEAMVCFAQQMAAVVRGGLFPLEALACEQIMTLRGSEERRLLFEELKTAEPSDGSNFWRVNVDAHNAMRQYIGRIASALATCSPGGKFISARTTKALGTAAAGGVGWMLTAASTTTGLPHIPAHLVQPVSSLVSAAVGNYIANHVQPSFRGFIAQAIEEGYAIIYFADSRYPRPL